MAEGPLLTPQSRQTEYQFELDVHIRKTRPRPLFQAFGKTIYEVEWINRDGPPILLLKIDGAKANREASYYVNLSCHPHIVQTFGLVPSNPGSVILLQECARYGDLSECFQDGKFKPTERVLYTIFKQICDAMVFLADNGIVHGDLACRNVLVFQSDPIEPLKNLVKLTDFGLTRASSLYSVVDSPTRTTMTIIPLRYAAPELLRNTSELNYSEKSDIYSMGALMWEACSYGELPYSFLEADNDVRRSKLNDGRLSRPSLCGDQLWAIMNECWHLVPEERPNFQTLKQFVTWTSTDINKQLVQRPTKLKSIVRIPCENCNEPIDVSNTSTHARICSARRKKPVCSIPKSPNNEKISERIPCEFCSRSCSTEGLLTHELNCLSNPTNMVPTDNSDRQRPLRNSYDNEPDDATSLLIPKDKTRRSTERVPIPRPVPHNLELLPPERKIGRKFRLPCCCC